MCFLIFLCVCVCVCARPPAARTRDVMKEFGDVYEQQYAVALFNSVRFEIEGGGATQSQLLHRKASGHTDTTIWDTHKLHKQYCFHLWLDFIVIFAIF